MSDKDPRNWSQEQERKEERWSIVKAELQAVGGSMFRSDLISKLENHPQIKSVGHLLGQLVRSKKLVQTGEDNLPIISLSGDTEETTLGTQNPTQPDLSEVFQQFNLFLARLVPISAVNASKPQQVTLSLTPIAIHNVGSMKQQFGDLEVCVPLIGGLRVRIADDVGKTFLPGSRAINKPLSLIFLPDVGSHLLIDGKENWDDFKITVPEGFWVVIEPEDSSDQVLVMGGTVCFDASMMYVSQDAQFADPTSMPIPLLWESQLVIGGNEGSKITQPYVGFAVLKQDLPLEYVREFEAQVALQINRNGQFAAILAFKNPGAAWIVAN